MPSDLSGEAGQAQIALRLENRMFNAERLGKGNRSHQRGQDWR